MTIDKMQVGLDFGNGNQREVGTLFYAQDKQLYFEYAPSFLENPLLISPFHLPVQKGILEPFDLNVDKIKGLPGVFYDSLPDGWGRLLLDRLVQSKGMDKAFLTPLDRLAYVGNTGMGALVYEPDHSEQILRETQEIDLRKLSQEVQEVLEGYSEDVLAELLALNGSSNGACPKAMIAFNPQEGKIRHVTPYLSEGYESWIVKFPNKNDKREAGAEEYLYAVMAQDAGIKMPETLLFRPKDGGHLGFFAVKRFDREGHKRLHMHSAAGLLNLNFREDFCDYADLLKLTVNLTKNPQDVEQLYRMAVFNVLSVNQDDHAKNFSFLMDENGNWRLSPAYDLTFSTGLNNYQATSVMRESKALDETHLTCLGQAFHFSDAQIKAILEQTKEALLKWENLAKDYGLHPKRILEIKKKICP